MQLKWKWILAVQEQVLDFGLVLRSISVWDQGSVERDELSWDGPRPISSSGRAEDCSRPQFKLAEKFWLQKCHI